MPLYQAILLTPILLLFTVVAWSLRPVRTVGPTTPSEAWVAAERHARRVVAFAWLVLLLAPAQALLVIESGRAFNLLALGGPMIAALPLIGGMGFLAVGAIGEVTWPRPVGAVRRAALERRRVRDIAPRGLSILTGTWTALLVAVLVVCGAVADDPGGALSKADSLGYFRVARPFPGWHYGRPLMLALVLVLLATFVVLALVARRPPVSDTAPAADVALRRTSCRRILAGVQLVLAWTFAGCLFFSARAIGVLETSWALGPDAWETIRLASEYVAVSIPVVSAVIAVRGSRAKAPAPAQVPAELVTA
ncbi:hypothetical protein [Cellulomonas sp. URHD0024]|uniref:hypothetical protein n=1 Tax=Cellulomonas sp. URHD0024 TaxID=1302620 RepID=UPI00041A4280|nr:hypothetical protein [Cellulomonas sp. URHD0024]